MSIKTSVKIFFGGIFLRRNFSTKLNSVVVKLSSWFRGICSFWTNKTVKSHILFGEIGLICNYTMIPSNVENDKFNCICISVSRSFRSYCSMISSFIIIDFCLFVKRHGNHAWLKNHSMNCNRTSNVSSWCKYLRKIFLFSVKSFRIWGFPPKIEFSMNMHTFLHSTRKPQLRLHLKLYDHRIYGCFSKLKYWNFPLHSMKSTSSARVLIILWEFHAFLRKTRKNVLRFR